MEDEAALCAVFKRLDHTDSDRGLRLWDCFVSQHVRYFSRHGTRISEDLRVFLRKARERCLRVTFEGDVPLMVGLLVDSRFPMPLSSLVNC